MRTYIIMTTAGYLTPCEIEDGQLTKMEFTAEHGQAACFDEEGAYEYMDLVAAAGFGVEMLDYLCVLQ